MTFPIAEISDKMFSFPEMWAIAGLCSIPVLAGLAGNVRAVIIAAVSGIGISSMLVSAGIQQSFFESEFSRAVHQEMGTGWIIHSLAAGFLPAACAAATCILHFKVHGRK